MEAESFVDRRVEARLQPASARALAAGDSVLLAAGWKNWADAAALERWDALSARAADPNPFFESWYLLPALRRFDPGGHVEILRFESAGELVALLPLIRAWRYNRWPLPHLRSWLHANSFLGAPLIARGSERTFWRSFLGWADSHAGAALFAHLSHLPLDGVTTQALLEVCADQGRRAEVVHREERAMLRSDLGADAYLEQAVRSKKRKELRRQHARLAEQGALAVERRDDERGLAVWVDHFLALEASGWKGQAGSALASSPGTEAMFREALTGAARRGRLERLSLTLEGRPIAMLANFLTPPGAASYKTAFDERYARFSPGVLLQLENLDLLSREGIDWCDSCAAPDHPMIDGLWRERRPIGRLSVAIGSPARRAAFDRLVGLELARHPAGIVR